MGQCRTLDTDVIIGCHYGDYSSPFLCPEQIFSLTLFCLLLYNIKVTASYCIDTLADVKFKLLCFFITSAILDVFLFGAFQYQTSPYDCILSFYHKYYT